MFEDDLFGFLPLHLSNPNMYLIVIAAYTGKETPAVLVTVHSDFIFLPLAHRSRFVLSFAAVLHFFRKAVLHGTPGSCCRQ